MNWNIEVPAGPASEFEARATAARSSVTTVNPVPSEAVDAQMDAAIAKAVALVEDVEPNGERHVSASLGGFADADPNTGTANGISIKVRQHPTPVVVTAPVEEAVEGEAPRRRRSR